MSIFDSNDNNTNYNQNQFQETLSTSDNNLSFEPFASANNSSSSNSTTSSVFASDPNFPTTYTTETAPLSNDLSITLIVVSLYLMFKVGAKKFTF